MRVSKFDSHIFFEKERFMSDLSTTVSELTTSLRQLLNDHPISTDNIEGWILIFLILFIVWNLCRKAFQFVGWSCALILLIQVCYFLGQTNLNTVIPIGNFFQYDVLTAIAQTCVGTPVCDWLLKINASIQYIILHTWQTLRTL